MMVCRKLKSLCLCISGAVFLCYVYRFSYFVTHKTQQDMTGPINEQLSPFIFKLPTGGGFISLTSGCIGCNKTCDYTVVKDFINCKGDLCLCRKSNPTLYFPNYFDNSIISKQDFHPLEIMSWLDPPTKHVQYLPESKSSKLTFTSGKNTGRVGEKVELILQLYDGFGKAMTRGGDDVRVRVHEDKKKMATSGKVKDLNNGSYVITVPTLWSGNNTVTVYVPFFREERSVFFRWLRQSNAVFYYKGVFSKGGYIQTTLCSPRPNIPGYTEICNLTYENGGNSWYCGAPPSKDLTCSDIYEWSDYHITELVVPEGEEFIKEGRSSFLAFKSTSFVVKGEDNLNTIRQKLPTCRKLPPIKTWQLDSPSGFVNNGVYFPTKCRVNLTDAQISSCLNDVTLILTGDSTTRQWYVKLIAIFGCRSLQDVTIKESSCVNSKKKIKIRWVPNTMPYMYHVRKTGKSRMSALSISAILDDIPRVGKYILVIHIYSHCSRHHYYVLQDKYRKLVPSLKRALNRNKNLIVLVKGPHMFEHKRNPSFHDLIGPILIDILRKELLEFQERLVYLDYWDLSMAYNSHNLHPTEQVVWNSLRLFFAYSCPY